MLRGSYCSTADTFAEVNRQQMKTICETKKMDATEELIENIPNKC